MLSVLDCWRRLEGSTPASHSVTVPTRKCVSGSDNPFPSSNLHYITFVLWLGAHTSAPTSEPDVTAIKSQSASLARLRRVLVTARALVLHGSPVKHRYSSSFSAFTLQNMRTGAARFASPTHTPLRLTQPRFQKQRLPPRSSCGRTEICGYFSSPAVSLLSKVEESSPV